MDSIISHENSGSTQENDEQLAGQAAHRLTKARSRTDTSVVAIIRSQTQNCEETTDECWWLDLLDTGQLIASFARADNGKTSTTVEPRVEQMSATTAFCRSSRRLTRSNRSRATSQQQDRGQKVEKNVNQKEQRPLGLTSWVFEDSGWCAN